MTPVRIDNAHIKQGRKPTPNFDQNICSHNAHSIQSIFPCDLGKAGLKTPIIGRRKLRRPAVQGQGKGSALVVEGASGSWP